MHSEDEEVRRRARANNPGCFVTGWKAIQIYSTMRLVNNKKTLGKMREEKMKELGIIK